jgi:hypothetical protein
LNRGILIPIYLYYTRSESVGAVKIKRTSTCICNWRFMKKPDE